MLLREKMDNVALLPDAVLPVLHEVLQSCQRVLHDRHHVFRGPGFHSNQHDSHIQLLLEDLRSTKCPSASSPWTCRSVSKGEHTAWQVEVEVEAFFQPVCSSYRICRVDHSFGKVLGLAAGATQLYKLQRDTPTDGFRNDVSFTNTQIMHRSLDTWEIKTLCFIRWISVSAGVF